MTDEHRPIDLNQEIQGVSRVLLMFRNSARDLAAHANPNDLADIIKRTGRSLLSSILWDGEVRLSLKCKRIREGVELWGNRPDPKSNNGYWDRVRMMGADETFKVMGFFGFSSWDDYPDYVLVYDSKSSPFPNDDA